MSIEIKKLPGSLVEITGEIDAITFEGYRAHVVEEIGTTLEVPGFRKGHVPAQMVTKYVSEMSILEEMAEHALSHEYPKILEENKIDAIGRPQIGITKIAAGNALGYKITTAVIPELSLADYKKIAKEENVKFVEPSVEDKEVDDALLEIRKMRASKKDSETTPATTGSETPEELPPIDATFLKSLGDFKDEDELRAKIKDNLKAEKLHREKEKIRIATLERLINETKTEIPEILIEGELENLLARVKGDITRMGLTFEGYLSHLKKTEEEFKKDLRPDAEKRAKIELVTAEIAKVENLTPEEKDIEHEVAHLLEHEPTADPIRARMYVTHLLSNEKVFKLLEEMK